MMKVKGKSLLMRSLLEKRAQGSHCISYKDLAHDLDVTRAPVISTVTLMLENLMEEDVKLNKPVLAALVVQKGSNKIPRSGFFEKLHSLNVININDTEFDELAWHKNELEKLKIFYKK